MGFWSKFGKIAPWAAMAVPGIGPALGAGLKGLGVGASVAANIGKAVPGVIGAIGKGGSKASDISQVLGTTAAGRAEGRKSDLDYTLKGNDQELARTRLEDTLAQNKYGNQLKQYELNASMPDVRAGQAVRGDLIANVQDASAEHPRANVVHFAGGLRPSALGPNARAAGAKLSQIGADNIGNEHMPNVPTTAAPHMTKLPQENAIDKILSVAGPAASLAAIFAKGKTASAPAAPAGGYGALETPGTVNSGGLETPGTVNAGDPASGMPQWPYVMDGPGTGGFGGNLPVTENPAAARFAELLRNVSL